MKYRLLGLLLVCAAGLVLYFLLGHTAWWWSVISMAPIYFVAFNGFSLLFYGRFPMGRDDKERKG